MEKQPDKNNPFKKLPQYKAPEHIWENIQKDLDEPEVSIPLKEGIGKLPAFKAPDSVWAKLEKELDKGKTIPMRPVYSQWWGAAAAVLLLVGFFGWFFSQQKPDGQEQFAQWEEVIEEDWQLDQNNDEDAFALVTAFCKQKQYVCETPEFQNLKAELDELNLACDALKEAIGQYNDEPGMIAQLTEIEMERTQVLKQIMTYL